MPTVDKNKYSLIDFLNKNWNRIGSAVAIILFIYLAQVSIYNFVHLKLYRSETIGVVKDLTNDAKGNPFVEYEFEVDGISYNGKSRFGNNKRVKIGDRYLVIYSYKNNRVSKMIVE
jgi:hypothetical protein